MDAEIQKLDQVDEGELDQMDKGELEWLKEKTQREALRTAQQQEQERLSERRGKYRGTPGERGCFQEVKEGNLQRFYIQLENPRQTSGDTVPETS